MVLGTPIAGATLWLVVWYPHQTDEDEGEMHVLSGWCAIFANVITFWLFGEQTYVNCASTSRNAVSWFKIERYRDHKSGHTRLSIQFSSILHVRGVKNFRPCPYVVWPFGSCWFSWFVWCLLQLLTQTQQRQTVDSICHLDDFPSVQHAVLYAGFRCLYYV